MIVVITGSCAGIGYATALKFLSEGHIVHGIDWNEDSPFANNTRYIHHIADVSKSEELPEIADVEILINNAGTQNSESDIQNNLIGVINCTKKYGLQRCIRSIINLASVSAHNGAEFPEYVASKGGVLSYTTWTAKEVAIYGATCNSLSFGGVLTDLNDKVINDSKLWNNIMSMTPLKRWATAEECAEWIYFFTIVNKSCTGQDLIVDNGEMINHKFVW